MLLTYQNFGDPTLRIDIRPAAFQVQVDGESREDGTLLLADSFTDSLEVAAVVSDDVDLSSIRVRDGSQELDGSRVQVTPPAATENGAQFYRVSFRTALRLEGNTGVDPTGAITQAYEVALEAVDWAGRGSRFAFPVVFKTRFLALDEGSERVLQYEPGGTQDNTTNIVEAITPLRVELTSAVPVTASSLEFLVDGVPVPVEARALDETGRSWVLEGGRTWFEGSHTAELHVRDPEGGELVSGVYFKTNSSDVPILNGNAYGGRGIAFYPNPAEGGQGSLLYELNRQAARAEVTVFTVGGRRILTAEAPTRPGTNAFRWQLRDQVGDSVGNGVYLFLLRIWDQGGALTTTEPHRVVVSR